MRDAGILCNAVLPAVLLFGFLAADGAWSLREALISLGVMVVATPLITVIVGLAMRRLMGPVHQALGFLRAGEPPDPALLDRARRLVLGHPWWASLGPVIGWGVVFPAVAVLSASPSGVGGGVTEALLAGFIVTPLLATISVFAFEAALRPTVAALFPEGGIEAYKNRLTLSVRTRVGYIVVFLGPFVQLVLSVLAYRAVAGNATTEAALGRLLWIEGYLFLASLVVVQIFAGFLRHGLGDPLDRLVVAMRSVRAGNLDVRVPVVSADNLGLAADTFNAMVRSLQEKSWLQDAFRRYVSPELESRVRSGPVSLGGELRVVTVLFSDLRGFTSLSERMSPETMVEIINRYFEAMVACVQAEGGTVNKFLGDGMMVLFGAPSELPDAPMAAVRSALAMQQALVGFNAEQIRRGLPELAIGIGIATGPVVVGNIGANDRLEYTAIGDVVNTASRIEGLTKDFGSAVLVDEATFEGVRGRVPIGMKGSLPVKGKVQPVPVYAPAVGTADIVPQAH